VPGGGAGGAGGVLAARSSCGLFPGDLFVDDPLLFFGGLAVSCGVRLFPRELLVRGGGWHVRQGAHGQQRARHEGERE
jgi:hypothetical protein